jgi:hypothetical protein
LATRDKLLLFMQKDLPASSFSFADITSCAAFRVMTIQLTAHFVVDKVELQFYSLLRKGYLWVPLEVVLRTASYPCLLALRVMMMANPELERIALWDLNSTWDCRTASLPYLFHCKRTVRPRSRMQPHSTNCSSMLRRKSQITIPRVFHGEARCSSSIRLRGRA